MFAAIALVLAACGGDGAWQGVRANGRPFAECVPPPERSCDPIATRSFALAICGDLQADNTLYVSGADADVALWVGDSANTSAPLSVEGDYWSTSNEARNTQTVSGATRENAPPPACVPSTEPAANDGRWDVRISEPARVVLGQECAYAQPSLAVDNTLEVHVRGDVTWVIARDARIAAPMKIVLEAGARLDWTILGSLDVDNTLTADGPAVLRVGGPIRIAAPFALDGSLLAPTSRVDVDNTLTITGAAYVGDLHVAAPMRVEGETLLHEDACVL